jgi:hemin uptake protein HemP
MSTVTPLPNSSPNTLNTVPIYYASDIVQGGSQANITLEDQVYTLCITRAGKLILTK